MKKFNINVAHYDQLRQIDGIGHKTARAIFIAQAHTFKSLEDLKDIPGIGEKRFKSIEARCFCAPIGAQPSVLFMFESAYEVGSESPFQTGTITTRFANDKDPIQLLGRIVAKWDWLLAIGINKFSYNEEERQILERLEKQVAMGSTGTAFVVGKSKPFEYAITAAHCVMPMEKKTDVQKLHLKLNSLLQKASYNGRCVILKIIANLDQVLSNCPDDGFIAMPHHLFFQYKLHGAYCKQLNVEEVHVHPDYKRQLHVKCSEDLIRQTGSDIAIIKLSEPVTPSCRCPFLTRLQGAPKELEKLTEVHVFGYLETNYINSNGSGVDSNTYIRGSVGQCAQTNFLKGEDPTQLRFSMQHGMLVIRGEISHGHSGSPAIVKRRGDIHIIGVVSQLFHGRQQMTHLKTPEYYADAAICAFTDETVKWMTSILKQDCPRFGRMSMKTFMR